MHLSWLGLSAFKVETKEAVIVTDPYSPQVGAKPLRAKADIVTVSRPDSAAHGYLGGIQGEPFVIDHPGEFEVKGVFLQGHAVWNDETKRGEKGRGGDEAAPAVPTTIFTMDLEGMRLAHLGDVRAVPPADILEWMNGVDVLLLPVGGGVTLDAEEAVKIINEVEPRVVVPMHFAQTGVHAEGKLAPVSAFLKEMGASKVSPVGRLLLKKKDLSTEETQVVVFSA